MLFHYVHDRYLLDLLKKNTVVIYESCVSDILWVNDMFIAEKSKKFI